MRFLQSSGPVAFITWPSQVLTRVYGFRGPKSPRSRLLALVERGQPLRHATCRGLASPGDVAKSLGPPEWRNYLVAGESESRLAVIRQRTRTHTRRPLGSAEFVHSMEKLAQRRLAPQKRGPREEVVIGRSQGELAFEP